MAQDMPGEPRRDTGDDVLERLQTLVDDETARAGITGSRTPNDCRRVPRDRGRVTDVLDRPTWDASPGLVVARLA